MARTGLGSVKAPSVHPVSRILNPMQSTKLEKHPEENEVSYLFTVPTVRSVTETVTATIHGDQKDKRHDQNHFGFRQPEVSA